MKLMVVGGGGREHALIRKLKENRNIDEIYCLPGNGGIAKDATCVDIKATDLQAIEEFAVSKGIDYAVVAPDDPLAMGLVDILEKRGIPCFGPNQKAAIIESSKAFAKDLMKRYGIPTAKYETFTDMDKALGYLDEVGAPIVVKADGLALGKGVIVAMTLAEARKAVKDMMEDHVFGKSGAKIVIEEYLEGPEVSVLSFTDGNTIVPMVSSMDHKRAKDNDEGLNTGGMGTIAPNPYYTKEVAERCMKEIFLPTIKAMKKEGRTFKGCLYFGLMITKDGPKVIEYNCRFGDPETQVVLPLLKSDLFTIMKAVSEERLAEVEIRFADECAACVVVASAGYPLAYEKGNPISIADDISDYVYVAGAKLENGELFNNGGRVLGVIATDKDLEKAIELAYERVKKATFANAYYRKDIGARALKALKEN